MDVCLYEPINGAFPREEDCKKLHPYGCDGCAYNFHENDEPVESGENEN